MNDSRKGFLRADPDAPAPPSSYEMRRAALREALERAEAELERVKFQLDGEREMKESQFEAHAKARSELERVKKVCAEMQEALHLLYTETADYITINHLGDVHHNRSMKLARLALKRAEEAGL